MRDLFLEDGADMLQTERRSVDAAEEIRDALAGRQVCPFCGLVKEHAEGPCERCTMENTASTRQATKARIGPWYVLQGRNPAAPGMKFDTLLTFVQKGKIKPRSIVRGPTTHQLWRFAAHVRGLSREFGICYSCGGEIERTANLCPHCNRLQEPPVHPDVFLESQDQEIAAMPRPVYRQISEPPLVGQDIVVPALQDRAAAAPTGQPGQAVEQSRAKRGADGFLSAQDLAAAFKLNFTPKNETAGRASGEPNQTGRRMKSRTRRHRRWKRWVFLLLVLVGAGAFAFQYHRDANFRALTQEWLNRGKTWVQEKIVYLKENANRAAHPAATQPALRQEGTTARQPELQAPATTQPSPWDQILTTQAAAPSSAASPPARARQAVQAQASADDIGATPEPPPTLEEARSLYRSAIDAEDQGDYAAAVKKYERIHKFPSDLWPRDLDLRLREARERLH